MCAQGMCTRLTLVIKPHVLVNRAEPMKHYIRIMMRFLLLYLENTAMLVVSGLVRNRAELPD
jgi:hypothetical protein